MLNYGSADLKTEFDKKVNNSGNEKVTGIKTFCQSGGAQQQHLLIQNDEMTTSIPAQEQWVGIAFINRAKNWLASLRYRFGTSGLVRSVWSVKNLDQIKTSELYHGFNASGSWESNIVVTDNCSQTIFGRKTFKDSGIGIIKSGSAIDIQNTAVDLTSTSISGTTEIHFIDKNNKVQGIVEHQNTVAGNSVMIMAARNHANTKWTTVEVGFSSSDAAYCHVPNPVAESNANDAATTYWVRNYSKNYGAQLNYAAAVTISGTGNKTAPASGVLIMTGKGASAAGEFKITIDGQTFACYQGYSGSDYNHGSFAYFPVKSGQKYTVDILSAACDLRFIPYQ